MSSFASLWHFAWFRNVDTGEMVNVYIPGRFQSEPWKFPLDGYVFHGFTHEGPRMDWEVEDQSGSGDD